MMKKICGESHSLVISLWTCYVTKVRSGVHNSTSSGTIAIEVAVQIGTIPSVEFTFSSGGNCNS